MNINGPPGSLRGNVPIHAGIGPGLGRTDGPFGQCLVRGRWRRICPCQRRRTFAWIRSRCWTAASSRPVALAVHLVAWVTVCREMRGRRHPGCERRGRRVLKVVYSVFTLASSSPLTLEAFLSTVLRANRMDLCRRWTRGVDAKHVFWVPPEHPEKINNEPQAADEGIMSCQCFALLIADSLGSGVFNFKESCPWPARGLS
ncbi:hypothetical protein LX36DRAFT_191407 [Colletotrichum falcatum]|nr:hypothetical protein LX36DRAFT_191407 [Colletotrichum falcatum]